MLTRFLYIYPFPLFNGPSIMANLLILMLVAILWFFLLVSGVYMIATRKEHSDRSRLFFGIFSLVSSYALLQKMFFMLRAEEIQDYYYVLSFREICFGLLCRYLFTLYPVEVARPNWLSARHIYGGFVCLTAIVGLYGLLFHFHETPLHTFNDLLLNIDKPDVVARLLMLCMMFPYEFVWTIYYDKKHSSAGQPWLRRTTFVVSLIVVMFIGNMLTRSVAWRSLHAIIYLIYPLYVLYIELFVRIPVPQMPQLPSKPAPQVQVSSTTNGNSAGHTSELQRKVRQVVEEEELWREPDLLLNDLVRAVSSNRTYVTQAIQDMGYTGFKEYINNLRVNYIRQRLQEPEHERIQDLFFEAGYRSRGAAWRNFTAIAGCPPTIFEEQVQNK